jgi:hypothetical protein
MQADRGDFEVRPAVRPEAGVVLDMTCRLAVIYLSFYGKNGLSAFRLFGRKRAPHSGLQTQ